MAFWTSQELGMTLIGALLGAVLTIMTGVGAFLIDRRKAEGRVLRELARSVAERRAFSLGDGPMGRFDEDDFRQLNQSVLALRAEAREARQHIVRDARILESLTRISKACNRYLEYSAGDRRAYIEHARVLKVEVWDEIHLLSARRSGVRVLEPGSDAF